MEMLTSFQDITSCWIEDLLKIDPGAVRSFTIRREKDFLVSRTALLDIDYREHLTNFPPALFVKITKGNLQQKLTGIGER